MELSFLAWLAPLLPLVAAAVLASPLVWVSLRVRSLFLLRARLWRWANKHDGGGHEWLGEPIAQRRELMKFRSLLAWADSYPQAQRVAVWATTHGIDLGTLGECGKYFDPNELAITGEPKKPHGLWAPVLLFLGYILLVCGFLLAIKSDAILNLRSNGHWVSLTETSARPASAHRYAAMTLADCKAGRDPAGLAGDRADACDFLADPRLPAMVAETVAGQKAAGGMLALVAFLMIWTAFGNVTVSREARAIRAVRNDLKWHESQGGTSGRPGFGG